MRAILVLFLTFLVLLTIGFLWKEHGILDFSKKINDEKIGNYFTALGSVATAISLFLLYRQIKEMQIDRTVQTRPDLQPAFTEFYLEELKREETGPWISPYTLDIYSIVSGSIFKEEQAFVEIKNIGRGAAKDIKVLWQYEMSNEMAFVLQNVYNYFSERRLDSIHEFPYLQVGDNLKSQAPAHFLATFSPRLKEYNNNLKTLEISYLELKLILIYQDMHHTRTMKEFYVKLNMDTTNKKISCKFEIHTINQYM